jgi:hypothetical protein
MPTKSYRDALLAHIPAGSDRVSARKVLEYLGLFGSSPTIGKIIARMEGSNPPPPPPPPQQRPSVSVTYDHSGPTFRVKGHDFLPSRQVHVRVVNNVSLVQVFFDTQSDSSGGIDYPITFAINLPQTYTFTANDGRAVPPSVDITGVLWSNPVTLTAT